MLLSLYLLAGPSRAAAPLETETARFAARGTLEAEGSFEAQRSKDGQESALPLAFEFALTRRLELMIGARWNFAARMTASFGVTVDTAGTVRLRSGIRARF